MTYQSENTQLGRFGLLFVLTAVLFAGGCGTVVRVTSEPPGATVYAKGLGRPAYGWHEMGTTPTQFRTWYSAQIARVVWPEGAGSELRKLPLDEGSHVSVHFVKPTTPAPAAVAPTPANP